MGTLPTTPVNATRIRMIQKPDMTDAHRLFAPTETFRAV
jgi:hypothetical protein